MWWAAWTEAPNVWGRLPSAALAQAEGGRESQVLGRPCPRVEEKLGVDACQAVEYRDIPRFSPGRSFRPKGLDARPSAISASLTALACTAYWYQYSVLAHAYGVRTVSRACRDLPALVRRATSSMCSHHARCVFSYPQGRERILPSSGDGYTRWSSCLLIHGPIPVRSRRGEIEGWRHRAGCPSCARNTGVRVPPDSRTREEPNEPFRLDPRVERVLWAVGYLEAERTAPRSVPP